MKEKVISMNEIRDKLGLSKKKLEYELVNGEIRLCKQSLENIPA